jgi:hypothetical protein
MKSKITYNNDREINIHSEFGFLMNIDIPSFPSNSPSINSILFAVSLITRAKFDPKL